MHITLGQHTIQYIVDPNLSIIEYLYHHQITNISISTTNAIPRNEINLSIINLPICIYQCLTVDNLNWTLEEIP